mmetsp:Transcript_10418/g.33307  ORF Transcript_10418/g.33307 Transcript_10418/m.33307 type:complete len:93 (-) Transcript_10418:554-832(-)
MFVSNFLGFLRQRLFPTPTNATKKCGLFFSSPTKRRHTQTYAGASGPQPIRKAKETSQQGRKAGAAMMVLEGPDRRDKRNNRRKTCAVQVAL